MHRVGLEHLKNELFMTMQLAGTPTIKSIGPGCVERAEVYEREDSNLDPPLNFARRTMTKLPALPTLTISPEKAFFIVVKAR